MAAPSFLRWLLAPVHLLALATGAKSFRDNPLIGSPFLNRMGLHEARVRLAHRMADWRRRRLARLVSAEDRAAFARDGFVMRRDFLPPAAFAALRAEILDRPAPAWEAIEGDTVLRWIALDRAALADRPAARALVEGPEWLGLVRYVGASRLSPAIVVQTVFAHAVREAPDPQQELHSDAFHPSVKAWLFLEDVGADAAPFVYVPGSHRPSPGRLAFERDTAIGIRDRDALSGRGSFRLSEADRVRYGFREPFTFAVPANTLVVADTHGFHRRGAAAGRARRIEIWAYGRRSPFLPWLGLDPAGLPCIRGRVVPLYWKILQWRERLGGRGTPWRPTGLARPDDPPRR